MKTVDAGEIAPKAQDAKPVNDLDEIKVGDWFWRTDEEHVGYDKRSKPITKTVERLYCVTHIGSNFIELTSPLECSARVHVSDIEKTCRREPNAKAIIDANVLTYQKDVQEALGEIKEVMLRIGVSDESKLTHGPEQESGRALSMLSGTDNMKHYKRDLIKAKEKLLPDLFQRVKASNAMVARWMTAETLPLQAASEGMKEHIEKIDDRIFNVSLYAGLAEDIDTVSEGAPAPVNAKLHLLQRMCYMDEECLLDYKLGGMEFKDIRRFDAWLAKPKNRDRLLPFPRSMVAFRVRRYRKDREWDGGLRSGLIIMGLEDADRYTYLYIRNGERLYRMCTEIDFGYLIFPGRDEFDLSEPMMAKMFCGSVKDIITKRHYDDLVKADEERKRKLAIHRKERAPKLRAWKKAHPDKKNWMDPPAELRDDPYELRDGRYDLDEYVPFNQTSVYFDEIATEIADRVKHYNRIALIIQGLFDRSEVLHPHPPVKLWDPGSFAANIELVYDGSNTLYHGEAPDFESYRRACNASLKAGSVTIGQDDYWAEREAEKERNRRLSDWRTTSRDSAYNLKRFRPYGNPGPGYVATIAGWSTRARRATYTWNRERLRSTWRHQYGDPIRTSLAVPVARLFNVSAYKPGDFVQFFVDPRTRADYLQWAPMLLAAEEYHAGNKKYQPGADNGDADQNVNY